MSGLDGWLLAKEAAYRLGITVSCLHRRALRGTIRSRMVGMIRCFNEEDIRLAVEVKKMRLAQNEKAKRDQGGLF